MPTTVSGSYPAVNSDSDATINGLTVGRGTGAIATNTAVGSTALNANTTGAFNTALGSASLFSNTTASESTATGYQAGYSNTTGAENNFFGYRAGYSNTTGIGNSAFGNSSLRTNTTGNQNTAIGGANTGVTVPTLYFNTTGSNNVGVGNGALAYNTTASSNTAVGYQAGYSNTTGNNNAFFGYQAGYTQTTAGAGGGANTYIGYRAGYSATGYYNTFVGIQAGQNSTGNGNTFVGSTGTYASGQSMTSGNNNTILGNYSGNNGGLDIRTASNYIVLSDGDGNPRGVFNPSGYFKASNDGTYVSVTGTYHEFRNTASDPAIYVTATNASFGSNAQIIDVTRAATSGYNFGLFRSSAGGDNEFVFRGDGNGYADGTWNNNGADYAEYFESATGQEIPVGSTVVLENNKVRLATVSDNQADVIGVVRPKEPSKASMVVGNTAWNKWANKYLTDDFDRYIMEDHDVVEWTDADGKKHSYESHNIPSNIVVPTDAVRKSYEENGKKFQHYKLNPAWNPNAEYINRENRDEWLIIGLVGQVKVSKGQIIGERWKKMRDVSASVEEWFIR